MIRDISGRCRTAAFSASPGRFLPSSRELFRAGLFIAGGVVTGLVAWSGHVLTLPVAVAFPALWAFAPSRAVAALVSAGYFLAASRGLPQGVMAFYSTDLWPGLLLWFGASVSFVAVHAALWTSKAGGRKAARYLATLLLMAVPPFGVVGWASPLTAAGILFPGWGWIGLAATVAGLAGLLTRYWPAAAVALGGFWLWSALTWSQPLWPPAWTGVDLHLGQSLGRDLSLARQRDLIAKVKAAARHGRRVVVLPESALGFWTPTTEHLWQEALRGTDTTVIAGAAVVEASGYENVMVAIKADGARVLYRERMPVPVSMWQPWRAWLGRDDGTGADFFGNPSVEIDGMRIAPLICYEQLVLWPILQSMLHSPDVVVLIGNGWWATDTTIIAIQQAGAQAWARLFNRPLVLAFNS